MKPDRIIAHSLAALLGVAALAAGAFAFLAGITPVLPVTLLVIGALTLVLATFSVRGSRAAWSFLVALDAVMFIVMFFGAPKVRSTLDTTFTVALIAPILLGITTVLLAMQSRDYETQ